MLLPTFALVLLASTAQPSNVEEPCDRLERTRLECEAGGLRGKPCAEFLAIANTMLDPCNGPSLSCGKISVVDCANPYGPPYTISRLPSREGRTLFASTRFRLGLAVNAEISQMYSDASLALERQISQGHVPAPPTSRASASSELPSRGRLHYDAGRVLDWSNETAWCEGVPGPGVGEWIEVRPACNGPVCALTIVSGYAKDEATFVRNGRPAKLRLSECGGSKDGASVNLDDEPQLQYLRASIPPATPACVRLTILEVVAGSDPDTCISEVQAACDCDGLP